MSNTATTARIINKIFRMVILSLKRKYAVIAVAKIYNEWIEVMSGNDPFVRATKSAYPPKKLKKPIGIPILNPPDSNSFFESFLWTMKRTIRAIRVAKRYWYIWNAWMSKLSATIFCNTLLKADTKIITDPTPRTNGANCNLPSWYRNKNTAMTARTMPAPCKGVTNSLKANMPTSTVITRLAVVVTGNSTFVSICSSAYICRSMIVGNDMPHSKASHNIPLVVSGRYGKKKISESIADTRSDQNAVEKRLYFFAEGYL